MKKSSNWMKLFIITLSFHELFCLLKKEWISYQKPFRGAHNTYIRMLYDSEKEWSGNLHETDRVSLLQQQQEQQQYSIQEIGIVAPHRTHTKVLHAGQMGLYYDDWFT